MTSGAADDPADAISRGFAWGAAAIAALIVALAIWVAGHEWFSQDDFIFLNQVLLRDPWSWTEVFLPLRERWWVFYRPLSMESYFYLGYQLFGLDAAGFFAVSLAVHFGSGPLVYWLARELGFVRPVAVATALLALSRPPSLTEVFYGSCFMYVAVGFFGLAALAGFLRFLRRGGAVWQVFSCAALLLAFMSNEIAVTLLPLCGLAAIAATGSRPTWGGLARIARALAPQITLTVLYLVFRFVWIAPVDNEFWTLVVSQTMYKHSLGPHVLPNAAQLVYWVFGSTSVLVGALAVVAACAASVLRAPPQQRDVGRLLRQNLLAAAWIAGVLPAFALMPQLHERWSMVLGVPVALGLGAWWNAAWRASPAGSRRLFEAATLGLLLLAIPYAALQARADDPKGGPPQRLARWIAEQQPPLPSTTHLVMVYGAPDLADPEEARRLNRETHFGRLLPVLEPESQWALRFHDAASRATRNVLRPDSVYVKLLPGIGFERMESSRIESDFARALSQRP